MTNVIGYCRVSTDGQAQQDKFGIDNQKAIIQSYAQAHDYHIVKYYIDDGQSGVKESRPAMDAILFGDASTVNPITNPPIEAVIVAKSDRIARDIKLYFYYMMLLEKRNIHLISATEQIVNDDTGLGNVYRSLMLFVAEQERKNIMKRTSGGRVIKASRGGYSGGRPPYGYTVRNHDLIPDPTESQVVRIVFRMRSKNHTYQQITDYLAAHGYATRNGSAFPASTLKGIYENQKLYRGYYKYKGAANDEWIRGEHDPILSQDDYTDIPQEYLD